MPALDRLVGVDDRAPRGPRGDVDDRRGGRGGYDDRRGGYDDRRGGFEDRRGGYNDRRGGYDDRRGGFDDRRGGYEESRPPREERPKNPVPDQPPFKVRYALGCRVEALPMLTWRCAAVVRGQPAVPHERG
jgi:hypothetical protein